MHIFRLMRCESTPKIKATVWVTAGKNRMQNKLTKCKSVKGVKCVFLQPNFHRGMCDQRKALTPDQCGFISQFE